MIKEMNISIEEFSSKVTNPKISLRFQIDSKEKLLSKISGHPVIEIANKINESLIQIYDIAYANAITFEHPLYILNSTLFFIEDKKYTIYGDAMASIRHLFYTDSFSRKYADFIKRFSHTAQTFSDPKSVEINEIVYNSLRDLLASNFPKDENAQKFIDSITSRLYFAYFILMKDFLKFIIKASAEANDHYDDNSKDSVAEIDKIMRKNIFNADKAISSILQTELSVANITVISSKSYDYRVLLADPIFCVESCNLIVTAITSCPSDIVIADGLNEFIHYHIAASDAKSLILPMNLDVVILLSCVIISVISKFVDFAIVIFLAEFIKH